MLKQFLLSHLKNRIVYFIFNFYHLNETEKLSSILKSVFFYSLMIPYNYTFMYNNFLMYVVLQYFILNTVKYIYYDILILYIIATYKYTITTAKNGFLQSYHRK